MVPPIKKWLIFRKTLLFEDPYYSRLKSTMLVRPKVEYAAAVWDPYTKVQNIEKIQRRAARFVSNDHQQTSSVKEMLKALDWPALETHRKAARLSTLYKIDSVMWRSGLPIYNPPHRDQGVLMANSLQDSSATKTSVWTPSSHAPSSSGTRFPKKLS